MTTESLTNVLELSPADAWALSEVLRHRSPCATDCEYCGGAGLGYGLALKVQGAILGLQAWKSNETRVEIRINQDEAWMIYRYLPRTAYDGAEALLLRVFKIIAAKDAPIELPPWADDLDLGV